MCIRDSPYLYLSLSGATRVDAPSLRVLPEGSALLIPQKTLFRVLAQDPCVFLEIEAKEGFCMNLIKTDEVFALKDLLPYEEGKIVNADIVNNPHMKMALMSFDAGCATPEHAAGGDAMMLCLEGEGVITNAVSYTHLTTRCATPAISSSPAPRVRT